MTGTDTSTLGARPSGGRAVGWMTVLFVLVLVAAALTQGAMRNTNLRGDEFTYAAGGAALGDALRGRQSWGDALDTLVGTGWFMPGASLLAAPLYALIDTPGFAALRTWMAVLSLAMLGGTAHIMARMLGRPAGIALLICPGLVAASHIAMIAVLPDIAAGMAMAIALLAAYRLALDFAGGNRPGWRNIAVLEAALVTAIYMRGPMVLTAVVVHGVLAMIALCADVLCAEKGRRMRNVGRLALGLAAGAALVAPWSIVSTQRFGQTIITTTNFPLVIADSFGNPDKTCFGPCGVGPDIWPAWHFAQDRAAQTGRNPLDVQREMMASALEGMTPLAYLRKAKMHFGTFLFDRTGLLEDMLPQAFGLPPALRAPMLGAVALLSTLVFVPFLIALFVVNLGFFRQSTPDRLQSILLKAATACMFIQPFVHKASARYWTTFAPLAAWSAVLLWQWLARCRAVTVLSAEVARTPLDTVLDVVQGIYVAVFAMVALTLLVV